MANIDYQRMLEDPLYADLYWMANTLRPEFDYDEEGNCIQMESPASVGFLRDIKEGNAKFPFSDDEFYKDKEVQRTLASMQIDSRSFLYAVKVLHYYTDLTFDEGYQDIPSMLDLSNAFIDILSSKGASLVLKGDKKTMTVTDRNLLNGVVRIFREEIGRRSGDINFVVRYIDFESTAPEKKNRSRKIAFEARMLKCFFDAKCGKQKRIDNINSGCINRTQLISKLMYITKLTDNDNFLYSDESLKGILRLYKNCGPTKNFPKGY